MPFACFCNASSLCASRWAGLGLSSTRLGALRACPARSAYSVPAKITTLQRRIPGAIRGFDFGGDQNPVAVRVRVYEPS